MSDCAQMQEAISAIADGEEPEIAADAVEAHVASCAECRAHREFVHSTRRGGLHEAAPQADLSGLVVNTARSLDGMWRWSLARVVLAVCAVWVIVSSLIDLFGHADGDVHDARHLGAFTLAYGVALAVVVVRPARARTVLPVAIVVSGALLVTAAIDVIEGHVPLVHETLHLPELVSVVAVWMLARTGLRGDGARPAPVRAV